MKRMKIATMVLIALAALLAGCSSVSPNGSEPPAGKADIPEPPDGRESSPYLIFVEFEFDGEVITDSYRVFDDRTAAGEIQRQLFYTVGQLNGDESVGRMDRIVLSQIERVSLEADKVQLRYHAKMLVGWGKTEEEPPVYTLVLPRDISCGSTYDCSDGAEQRFVDDYADDCANGSIDHPADLGSMWYYYRPNKYSCPFRDARDPDAEIAADVLEDIVVIRLSTTPAEGYGSIVRSAEETSNKYPEYHQIWKDDVLKVVAIFGKFEEGAEQGGDGWWGGDPGIGAYNNFIADIESMMGERIVPPSEGLEAGSLATIPEELPPKPGDVIHPDPDAGIEGRASITDVTLTAILPHVEGETPKRIEVVALLVENIRQVDEVFRQRYRSLTPLADFIGYSGHSGLGANIRAMARMGAWAKGQYVISYLNGCDTYAYVDGALANSHKQANPDELDDPQGTKYLDMLVNAMPSPSSQADESTFSLVEGLLSYIDGSPLSYVELLGNVPSSARILVTGEADNVFDPETPPPAPPPTVVP